MEHRVSATVIDLDHYRIGGGLAVETDYIVRVEPIAEPQGNSPQIGTFLLSKTYSAFRTFGNQLKKSADAVTSKLDPLPKKIQRLAHCAETVVHLVESERTQYLGKVRSSSDKIVHG